MVFSFFVTVLFILDVIFMFARACMKIHVLSARGFLQLTAKAMEYFQVCWLQHKYF